MILFKVTTLSIAVLLIVAIVAGSAAACGHSLELSTASHLSTTSLENPHGWDDHPSDDHDNDLRCCEQGVPYGTLAGNGYDHKIAERELEWHFAATGLDGHTRRVYIPPR